VNNRFYRETEKVEINIAPLIDMMFLLLIFFIVTTSFVENVGVEIKKPKAATSQTLSKECILIGVTKEGKVVYANREIGLNGVRALVSRLLKQKEAPVVIIADEDLKSGILVDVIDECKLAGAKMVSIATEKE